MQLEIINNWTYKALWNKFFGYYFVVDCLKNRHLLIGFLNIYFFITWK